MVAVPLMFPAAYLTDFGPGGAELFYSLLIFSMLAAFFYAYWRRRRNKKKWERVLEESRENRKKNEIT